MGDEGRLLLIVGAGASSEFNLPVGAELVKSISELGHVKLDAFGTPETGDSTVVQGVQTLARELNADAFHDLAQIRKGMGLAPSIDNYLHMHSGQDVRVRIGKFLIALAILRSEQKSNLFFEQKNSSEAFDFSALSDNWLSVLFKVLVSGGRLEDLVERLSRIRFITFNYDRVIEWFFFLALQVLFDLSENDAGEFCQKNLNILHVYGDVGGLQYRNRDSGFGAWLNWQQVLSASKNVRLFTEPADQKRRAFIRKWVVDADAVFFLGFSFLKLNMEVLTPEEIGSSNKKVIGTAYGMSESNLNYAKDRIAAWMPNGGILKCDFQMKSVRAHKLIDDYSELIAEMTI